MSQTYPFTLMPLPYPYDSLLPYIDTATMHYHHDNHLQTYVDKLNAIIKPHPQYHGWTLRELVINYMQLPDDMQEGVRNNAGGVYNHEMYFKGMTPRSQKEPVGMLKEAIRKEFGSFANWRTMFINSAVQRFGSGYAWLMVDTNGRLRIGSTANQDCVLTLGYEPVLLIDVWEHSYYLHYQYRRPLYCEQYMEVIDWEVADQRYRKAIK